MITCINICLKKHFTWWSFLLLVKYRLAWSQKVKTYVVLVIDTQVWQSSALGWKSRLIHIVVFQLERCYRSYWTGEGQISLIFVIIMFQSTSMFSYTKWQSGTTMLCWKLIYRATLRPGQTVSMELFSRRWFTAFMILL